MWCVKFVVARNLLQQMGQVKITIWIGCGMQVLCAESEVVETLTMEKKGIYWILESEKAAA